ncbi:MAG: hypothetical protein WAT79_05750 [Saprospiraceae bacterium]
MEKNDSPSFFDPYREWIFSFPGAHSLPHFDRESIRLDQKIWLTIDLEQQRICTKFSLSDQEVFCLMGKKNVYPVPNKWGLQGSTYIHPTELPLEMVKDMLTISYLGLAHKKYMTKYYDQLKHNL